MRFSTIPWVGVKERSQAVVAEVFIFSKGGVEEGALGVQLLSLVPAALVLVGGVADEFMLRGEFSATTE